MQFIKETIEQILKEYVTNEMIHLKDYFNMSDEQKKNNLPHEYPWFVKDFIEEEDIDIDIPEDMESIDILEWIEREHKEIFDQYAEYLYKKIDDHELGIYDAEYPAWSFFDSPRLIKNQWLIHFTDDADSIASNGFTRGVSEIEKLGLTTSLGEFDKKYGGYNFAYRADNFSRYAKLNWNEYKYGKEAVLFRASGMELWHYSDQEPQVIFYGNTARDIIPITSDYYSGNYAVYGSNSDRPLYQNEDLEKVVYWVIRNFVQYRKELIKK
jgi:hypothetical protein